MRKGLTAAAGVCTVMLAVGCGDDVSVSLPGSGQVGTPANVAVANDFQELTVSWDDASGAESYNLFWSNSSGGAASGTEITDVASPFTHTGLDHTLTYYYVVEAVAGGTAGDLSSEVGDVPLPFDTLVQGLVASDMAAGPTGDRFAQSVALDGDTAIVGAALDNFVGTDAGSAYIFERDPATGEWTETAHFAGADSIAGTGLGDQFGWSVDISGDLAIIGAQGADNGGNTDQGAAYVFVRDPGTGNWSQEQKLTHPGAANDHYGFSVAISGNKAIVGAPDLDITGADRGRAFIYTRSGGGVWTQEASFDPGGGGDPDRMGGAVDMDTGTAMVGSPGDATGGAGRGSVRFYEFDGTSAWNLVTEIFTPFGVNNDAWGTGVALDGNTGVAGAIGAEPGATTNTGAAYVIEFNGTNWVTGQLLTAPDGQSGDEFGGNVAIAGNRILVASQLDIVGGIAAAGSVWAFHLDPGTGQWVTGYQLTLPSLAANDEVGNAVAVDAEHALIGAYQFEPLVAGTPKGNAGTVFIWE